MKIGLIFIAGQAPARARPVTFFTHLKCYAKAFSLSVRVLLGNHIISASPSVGGFDSVVATEASEMAQ